MSMPPSPWAPRPGYQRSSALPQTSTGTSARPGIGQRYQVHRESAPFAPEGQADPQAVPAWTRPGPHSERRTGEFIARLVLALLGAGLMLVVIWLASQSASDLSVLSAAILLALIPLGLVLLVVFWIDRWEPEPLPTLIVAFLWGAGVSTAISMLVNTTVLYAAAESTLSLEGAFQISAVVSAPLIEETTKGLGVLIIFLIWRRTFNGAVLGLHHRHLHRQGSVLALRSRDLHRLHGIGHRHVRKAPLTGGLDLDDPDRPGLRDHLARHLERSHRQREPRRDVRSGECSGVHRQHGDRGVVALGRTYDHAQQAR